MTDRALRMALAAVLGDSVDTASVAPAESSPNHQIRQKPQVLPAGASPKTRSVDDPLTAPLDAVVAELNHAYIELGLEAGDVEVSAAATLAEARMDNAAQETDWPGALEALAAWRTTCLADIARASAQKRGELW